MPIFIKKLILIIVLSIILFLITKNKWIYFFFTKIKNLIVLLIIYTLMNFYLGIEYYELCNDLNDKVFYSLDYILYVSISFALMGISLFSKEIKIIKTALIVEFLYWLIKLFLLSGFYLSQIFFIYIAVLMRILILKLIFKKNFNFLYICLLAAFIAFLKDLHAFVYFSGFYRCSYNIIQELLIK